MLEFKVLGPLRILVDNEEIPVDDPVDRAFLTDLLLNPNRAFSVAIAVESADRLRRLIDSLPGTTRLVERSKGLVYQLDVDEGLIDYSKAQALYAESRRHPRPRRAELLREALELWPASTNTAGIAGDLHQQISAEWLEATQAAGGDTITRTKRELPKISRGTATRVPGSPNPKLREAVLRAVEELGYKPATNTMAVSMYLSDESAHTSVEAAVEAALATVGLAVVERDDPILGSWFRRLRASELGAVAMHAADSRLVLAQDAQVASTLLANLGPVLTALQPLKEAVIRLGAVLIVKLDDQLAVHQLTAAQQLQLDHQPQLAMAPREILVALGLEGATRDIPQRPLREIT